MRLEQGDRIGSFCRLSQLRIAGTQVGLASRDNAANLALKSVASPALRNQRDARAHISDYPVVSADLERSAPMNSLSSGASLAVAIQQYSMSFDRNHFATPVPPYSRLSKLKTEEIPLTGRTERGLGLFDDLIAQAENREGDFMGCRRRSL